ncbi:hypothetical protein [Dactylosporangium sp. CA-139066]|uniref:hypothetical protein n=1 Tax=Dactylosporangium sp. CA-139066 TaxID=3239930 RepID=UPI003D931102
MRHTLDDDRPVSPFHVPSAARADKLAGALTDRVWEAFYTADRVVWLARAKGHKVDLPPELDGHSFVDLIRAIVFTDPYAIYNAAGGLTAIYDTVIRQGHNLANRYTDVGLDWEGPAAERFGGYNDGVINYLFKDNHFSIAQFLQDTVDYLMAAADSVIDMRTQFAQSVCTVASSGLDALKDALAQLEDDERNLVQEIVEGIFTDGIATGLQVITELGQAILGVLKMAVDAVEAAITLAGIEQKQAGAAVRREYLGKKHVFESTAPSGDAPADFGDYQEWKLAS